MQRRDEPVAAARQRLNKARVIRRVVEGLAEPFHRSVETKLKVNKCIGGPKFSVKLFARNQFARSFQQTHQNLKRLPLQPDLSALLLQLARTQVQLKNTESDQTRRWYHWSECSIRRQPNTRAGPTAYHSGG